jgi:hypothetical protein
MVAFFLAIPTYWTHPEGHGGEDIIFDHPTPLNIPGTLRRTLESLIPLVNPGVTVGVVAATAAPELNPMVEARVWELLTSPPLPYPVVFFSASHLAVFQDFLRRQGKDDWGALLSLAGYGAIRNLTLVLANLHEAEVLVSLDDDEVIEDKDFLTRITADLTLLGKRHPVCGLAGLYLNANGQVYLSEPEAPWALFWPKLRWMNQTFAELLEAEEPLPRTPLALGGNLALPASVFRQLPFDPLIPRGEDVDYVVNARMWGIPFFLDKNLRILHLPPEKPHPTWLRLRQDLVRFAYARRKLREQEPYPGLVRVSAQELVPYPGNFLMDDLEERAHRSHSLLALEYLTAGDTEGAHQTLENLRLLQQMNQGTQNTFRAYLDLTTRWHELQTWLADPGVAAQARRALWG